MEPRVVWRCLCGGQWLLGGQWLIGGYWLLVREAAIACHLRGLLCRGKGRQISRDKPSGFDIQRSTLPVHDVNPVMLQQLSEFEHRLSELSQDLVFPRFGFAQTFLKIKPRKGGANRINFYEFDSRDK